MKRTRFLIVASVVTLALLLTLVGCSDDGQTRDYAGKYFLYQDNRLTSDYAMDLTGNGWMYNSVYGSYNVEGDVITCKLRDGGVYATGTIADGVLTLDISGVIHVFYKQGTPLPSDANYTYTVNSRCDEYYSDDFRYYIREGGSTLTLTTEQYLGYGTFDGWYLNGEKVGDTPECEVTLPAEDAYYEAVWLPVEHLEQFIFTSTKDTCVVRWVKDTSVKTLYMPDCVTSVENEDFLTKCTSLVQVSLPFAGEDRLSTPSQMYYYYLPETLREIEIRGGYLSDCSFQRAHNLTTVILSGDVQMGVDVFAECQGITTVVINVPTTGAGTFMNCPALSSITLSEGVTEIGDSTFAGCSSVQSLTFPSTLEKIGDGAFVDLTALQSVQLNSGLRSIGNNAFAGCTDLTEISIPEGVVSISRGFLNDTNVTELVLPTTATDLAHMAFDGMAHLEKLTLQTLNGERARMFFGTQEGDFEDGIPVSLRSVTIREGDLADRCFYNMQHITEVVLEGEGQRVGAEAFYGCTSLTSVTIPDSVTSIGDNAFIYCTSLKSVTIPNSVTSLGDNVFYGCTSLKSVTIPNSVTSIGNETFRSCTSLESVTIPNSVTSIGDYAFSYCASLESVTIGNSVKSIGRYAFSYCTSLTSIRIPDSVTSISENAFSDCTSLTSIIFEDTSTWYITASFSAWSNKTGGTSISVTSASTNATYFTSTYYFYYWYKL